MDQPAYIKLSFDGDEKLTIEVDGNVYAFALMLHEMAKTDDSAKIGLLLATSATLKDLGHNGFADGLATIAKEITPTP